MKLLMMLVACLTAVSSMLLPVQAEPLLKVTRLADGVYAAIPNEEAGVTSNSGFIVTQEGVWVVDAQTPEASRELLAEIRKVTDLPVQYVIHTHHHREMVQGNSVFPGARIIGHVNMRSNLLDEPQPGARNPDLVYDGKLIYHDGADRRIEIIHLGPYHTDGDSIVYLPKEKILFSGDLYPQGIGGMRQAFAQGWLAAVNKALEMEIDIVVPGRRGIRDKEGLREHKKYLEDLIGQIKSFIRQGKTAEEAVAGVRLTVYDKNDFYQRTWANAVRRIYEELKGSTQP